MDYAAILLRLVLVQRFSSIEERLDSKRIKQFAYDFVRAMTTKEVDLSLIPTFPDSS